ncbi:MAG: hypothetical protein K2X39_01275, partial [Silvanigrellaceae bacterium]|nr:hypothetical protein [Silvanigrellaceae bacterium]
MALQFFEAARNELPEVYKLISQGQFAPLKNWLTENLYTHGSKFSAEELLFRVTKSKLSIQPYIDYLKNKYS